ncbi:MAG: hypothetical protein Terrestrivirus5_70 [Terrestrivirus sp.]|uniref:Uncharacterized protein n=1 Tax=Terrestrivirus sp. TaxID=2487775 RepID=A0A3G4ZN22_9VIRU|nr:MAG: hypothetical protein Terrestrivirus5_70 [Terrestrivirus sp.]
MNGIALIIVIIILLICVYFLFEAEKEHYETIPAPVKNGLVLTIHKSGGPIGMEKTVQVFDNTSYKMSDHGFLIRGGSINEQVMLAAIEVRNNFNKYYYEINDQFRYGYDGQQITVSDGSDDNVSSNGYMYDNDFIVYDIVVDNSKIDLGNLDNIPNDLLNQLGILEILFH